MNGTKLGRISMVKKSSVIIWNTEELHNEWNDIAETYRVSDSTMQTFYYSLVHMMELGRAEHILEVACGTGKLLPLAINLKQLECTYLASDFSEKMIQYSLETIEGYLDKMGVDVPAEEWMDRNNLTLQVANCMKPIPSEYKFDRIIANLVLQGGQEPEVMMKNFYRMAEEGCLLGVGVWGKEEDNNIFNMIP